MQLTVDWLGAQHTEWRIYELRSRCVYTRSRTVHVIRGYMQEKEKRLSE